VVYGAGYKAKRLVMQYINGASSNPVEGEQTICILKNLILTLFGLISSILYGSHALTPTHTNIWFVGLFVTSRISKTFADVLQN
jgi:hypothetical protein